MSQKKQAAFLETSIQVKRVLAPSLQRIQIERELASSAIHPITSHYVWMEYQRTVLADYAHVHRVMGRCIDWSSLFEHILDGSRAFRPRSAVRCTQIIGQIHRTSNQSYELARQMISTHITYELRQLFWTEVTPLNDLIRCDLVESGTVRSQDGNYTVSASCRKESAACHLPNFLSDNQAKLRTIADYLASHPRALKNQTKVEALIASVVEDPRAALGQASCWPLGDLIIALQVPADAALWTLDADFEAFAAALGLQLYSPQQH